MDQTVYSCNAIRRTCFSLSFGAATAGERKKRERTWNQEHSFEVGILRNDDAYPDISVASSATGSGWAFMSWATAVSQARFPLLTRRHHRSPPPGKWFARDTAKWMRIVSQRVLCATRQDRLIMVPACAEIKICAHADCLYEKLLNILGADRRKHMAIFGKSGVVVQL